MHTIKVGAITNLYWSFYFFFLLMFTSLLFIVSFSCITTAHYALFGVNIHKAGDQLILFAEVNTHSISIMSSTLGYDQSVWLPLSELSGTHIVHIVHIVLCPPDDIFIGKLQISSPNRTSNLLLWVYKLINIVQYTLAKADPSPGLAKC